MGRRLAQDLHEAGVRPGDRVSIWLPSRIESALVFIACSRMGYVCNTSLHRDYTCREIVALLERAGSAAFFAQPGYGADAGKNDIFAMLGGLPRLKKVYRVDPLPGHIPIDDRPIRFGAPSRASDSSALPCSTDPDRIVYLAFTSGTTGQPKGVMHSDNTILANARAMVKDWAFRPGHGRLFVQPDEPQYRNGRAGGGASSAAANSSCTRRSMRAGCSTASSRPARPILLGVPTHAIDLLSEMRRRGMSTLGGSRPFELGGSPVPPTTVRGH